MKRRFSAKQKAQIVLEVLKEEKTIVQIASEYQVHPNQLHRWKKQALDNFAGLFETDEKQERAQDAAHQRQMEELYAEIGLTTVDLAEKSYLDVFEK
jgi:putative transposase